MTQKSETGAGCARAMIGSVRASVEKDPGFFATLRMTRGRSFSVLDSFLCVILSGAKNPGRATARRIRSTILGNGLVTLNPLLQSDFDAGF